MKDGEGGNKVPLPLGRGRFHCRIESPSPALVGEGFREGERAFLPTILITRPEVQAQETARKIVAEGLGVPLIVPLLESEAVEKWSMPRKAPAAILLSSANAAGALARLPDSWRRCVPLYAVGEATARAARRVWPDVLIEVAAGDGKSLCALIRLRVPPQGSLLHLSGEMLAVDFARVLTEYRVVRRVVYRVREVESLSDDQRAQIALADIALAYSPHSASVLAGVLNGEQQGRMVLACLSSAVAKAAGKAWGQVLVATVPNEEALLDLLRA